MIDFHPKEAELDSFVLVSFIPSKISFNSVSVLRMCKWALIDLVDRDRTIARVELSHGIKGDRSERLCRSEFLEKQI